MKKIITLILIFSIYNLTAQVGFQTSIHKNNEYIYGLDVIEKEDSSLLILGEKVYCNLNPVDCIGSIKKYRLNKQGIILEDITINNIADTNQGYDAHKFLLKDTIIFITGSVQDNYTTLGTLDNLLITLNDNTNTFTAKTYGDSISSDYGYGIINFNNYVYVGGLGDSSYNPTLLKTDNQGNTIFYKSYNAPFMYGKLTKGIISTTDSNIIIVGDGNLSVAAKDKWMVKTNQQGDTLLCKVLTNTGEGGVYGITHSYKNSFYLLGSRIYEFDYDGNLLNNITYPQFAFAFSMTKTLDNNFVMAGVLNNDITLTKIDTFGNVIWNKTFDINNRSDEPSKVIATKDGGYVICGTSGLNGQLDAFVIKVDSVGELHYTTNINFNEFSNSIYVYPNPATDFISIKSELEVNDVKIYNMGGQIIIQSKTNNIDISNLALGNYIIEVQTNKNYLKQKFTKK